MNIPASNGEQRVIELCDMRCIWWQLSESHLNDFPLRLVHLVHDHRRVFHELSDGVHVIVRDEQQVFRARTKEDLILESHDHQLIKLQESKWNHWQSCQMFTFLVSLCSNKIPEHSEHVLVHLKVLQMCSCFSCLLNTLSMLAGFSLMMEACANRVSTVFIVLWEYSSWGLRSSSMKALLNMVPTMSFITAKSNETKTGRRRIVGAFELKLNVSHWGKKETIVNHYFMHF